MAHRKGVENDGPTRILRNGTPCNYNLFKYMFSLSVVGIIYRFI